MKWVRALILSTAITAGAGLGLLSAIAFFVCRSESLPRGSVTVVTTLAACAAVFLGGLLSSISAREKGLLLGIGAGAVFLVCAGLVSVLDRARPRERWQDCRYTHKRGYWRCAGRQP